MEVSGQFPALAASPLCKQTSVSTG